MPIVCLSGHQSGHPAEYPIPHPSSSGIFPRGEHMGSSHGEIESIFWFPVDLKHQRLKCIRAVLARIERRSFGCERQGTQCQERERSELPCEILTLVLPQFVPWPPPWSFIAGPILACFLDHHLPHAAHLQRGRMMNSSGWITPALDGVERRN